MLSHVVPMQGCLQTSCMLSHSDMLCGPSFGHTVKSDMSILMAQRSLQDPVLTGKMGSEQARYSTVLAGSAQRVPTLAVCSRPLYKSKRRGFLAML